MDPTESESLSARLARIEARQQQHGEMLARAIAAVELIAAMSERMSNHIEDTKRLRDRQELSETKVEALHVTLAEHHAFYQDAKKGLVAILGMAIAGGAWLVSFWVERSRG